jgi:hypothetical protein
LAAWRSRLPKHWLRQAATLFSVQIVQYSVVCFSYRVLAQANIKLSVATDLFYAALNYTIIRKVAQAQGGVVNQVAYALGSAIGTYFGIIGSIAATGK